MCREGLWLGEAQSRWLHSPGQKGGGRRGWRPRATSGVPKGGFLGSEHSRPVQEMEGLLQRGTIQLSCALVKDRSGSLEKSRESHTSPFRQKDHKT